MISILKEILWLHHADLLVQVVAGHGPLSLLDPERRGVVCVYARVAHIPLRRVRGGGSIVLLGRVRGGGSIVLIAGVVHLHDPSGKEVTLVQGLVPLEIVLLERLRHHTGEGVVDLADAYWFCYIYMEI